MTRSTTAAADSPTHPVGLSVIVTCFRQADLLLDMLPRLFAELEVSDEVIVSDDGSPDGSAERLRSAFAHEARLRVLANPAARSVSVNRNRGLRAARGQWLRFLDGDDELIPGWRAALGDAFLTNQQHADILFSDFLLWNGEADDPGTSAMMRRGQLAALQLDPAPAGQWAPIDAERFEQVVLTRGMPLHICSTVFRRSWLLEEHLRFDRWLCVAEDSDFLTRATSGARLVFTPTPYARYRRSGNGLDARADAQASLARVSQASSLVALMRGDLSSPAADAILAIIADRELDLAFNLRNQGHASRAIQFAVRSFALHPTRHAALECVKAVMRALIGAARRPPAAP